MFAAGEVIDSGPSGLSELLVRLFRINMEQLIGSTVMQICGISTEMIVLGISSGFFRNFSKFCC